MERLLVDSASERSWVKLPGSAGNWLNYDWTGRNEECDIYNNSIDMGQLNLILSDSEKPASSNVLNVN